MLNVVFTGHTGAQATERARNQIQSTF